MDDYLNIKTPKAKLILSSAVANIIKYLSVVVIILLIAASFKIYDLFPHFGLILEHSDSFTDVQKQFIREYESVMIYVRLAPIVFTLPFFIVIFLCNTIIGKNRKLSEINALSEKYFPAGQN
jgi:hypothetical protein